ncbi:MAG: hypothetical protein BMS9Abin29_1051 [Gemmatimonadota bacterium]|nr:MAG: hypothetical protein BMS9Abin29_1051 [Gemmatimonadota bacterium]
MLRSLLFVAAPGVATDAVDQIDEPMTIPISRRQP